MQYLKSFAIPILAMRHFNREHMVITMNCSDITQTRLVRMLD